MPLRGNTTYGIRFHVFVDRYYQSAIVRNHGQWRPMLNDNTVLSPEQVQEVMRVAKGVG